MPIIVVRSIRHQSAGVAQLVERHLPKVNVVSSNLITRLRLILGLKCL